MKKVAFSLLICFVMVTFFAHILYAELPVKKFFPPDSKSKLYTPGVLVGKTFYVSGHGSALPGGGQLETFPEQAGQCLRNIRRILQLAGLDMEHVVKAWVMLDDLENYQAMNGVFKEFFPSKSPARTTLGVKRIPGSNHIEITVIAYTNPSERKVVGTPNPNLPFSPGILAGNTLYISGKGDHLPGGGHPATFEEQVRQSLKNVGTVLSQAGLDYRHVVWSNMYLDNYDNLGIANNVYSEFFESGKEPASSTVFVDELPGDSHIEITCIATTDLSSRKIVRPPGMKYGHDERAPSTSPGVWAGNTLYLSAQTGYTPEDGQGTINLEKQVRQMMQNHFAVLYEAGLGFKDIVSGNVFLRNIDDYSPMNEIYGQYFSTSFPGVRTCFQPFSGYERNDVRLRAYFFAAKTENE
ncbi:Rid family hydrolase [Candidatus Latescibacterota bacterium]